ncbi:MAG: LysR family transcriptional regulator substrate-binding protein [Nitrospirota bacterium]|nr:LysR family transcriptional regulator substrate-binding protein [Nitrospirota bacterium]
MHDHLTEDIAEHKGLKKGRLRVAAPFTTLYHLLPAVIERYTQRLPWVELSLLDRPQREVIELVKKGDVDFGIALESRIPAELNKQRWKKVEPTLLTPREHSLSKLKKISLEEIVQNPLILPPKSGEFPHRTKLEELFRERGLNYFVIMESSNVELSALYVEKGLGVSFASIVKGLPVFREKKLSYVSLDHLISTDHICVTTRKNKIIRSFQETFLEILFSS